ncbi:hypothetical protein BSKO_01773 [Bryopsis sp. KO-2023]|nr:hypothetical protein BSKO_01773 [Bryopsis sp. KO-2023]
MATSTPLQLNVQPWIQKRGPQSEAVAKCIARDIVSVLEACEREGIEHGKVHPQNFWIKSLRDFATVAKGNSTQRTVGGSLLRSIRMGSCGSQGMSEKARGAGMGVLYWAPEVFVDQPASNSDIWSMGVLLYNVLTGQNPIWSQEEIDWIAELPKGEQGLWFSLLRDLLWRQVDFSTKELAGVSEECKSFLKVTLSKNSQQRISLQEARNHPWLKEIAATAPPSGSSGAGNEEKKPQQQAEQRGNDRCVGNRFTLATRSRKLPLRQTIPTRTQQKQLVNRRW